MVADLLAQARRFAQSGHLGEAAKKYQEILALEPQHAGVHFELGVSAFHLGEHRLAIEHLQKAVALESNQPVFHNGLGIAYSGSGDLLAGMRCFERVLELDPDNLATQNNLGNNYKSQGRLADAADCYRKTILANPGSADGYINLGEVLQQQGRSDEAAGVYREAIAAGAGGAELQFKLASTLHLMGNYPEAATLFATIIADHAGYPGAHNNLGLALMRLGRFDEAIASYQAAIQNEPEAAAPHNNLGNTLRDLNDLVGAIASYRRALAIRPDHAQAHSNVLLALNYLPDKTPAELYEAALQFDRQQVPDSPEGRPDFNNARDRHRRLRVGYVSPDFRAHSVAHFTKKLIGAHDRGKVEVFCYANVIKQDRVTDDFRARTDHWVSIVAMDDRAVVERIRRDQIDILIDLAGHTANNRLLMFARRPAPIQVSWLGYPNTTGMSCMDYRLTDAVADPPGEADRLHAEKLIRLPHGFLCYQSDDPVPAVSALPFLKRNFITFGSFNSLPKITPEVVRVWSKILVATPGARLILKSSAFADENTRARYLQEFREQGIAPERLDLFGLIPGRDQHLAMYSNIDIALDTFPYNGTTTTFEALWMGVPVITLRGDRHAGRVGASILQHVGVPELVATGEDEYVEMACSLAKDTHRLVALRAMFRPKMRASTLMDTARFTRSLEEAYRDMWKDWCDRGHE